MNVQPVYASLFMGDTSGQSGASAALLDNGSVVTRGEPACGGAGSVVQEQLIRFAFAGLFGNGCVVSRRYADNGGDTGAVQEQRMNVQNIPVSG